MPVVLAEARELTMQSILAIPELQNNPSLAAVVDILNEVQTMKCFEPDEAIKAARYIPCKESFNVLLAGCNAPYWVSRRL